MILDIITYNYTSYYSFFFLNYLNKKNIYFIIFIGLLIDNLFLNTYFILTLILLILYFLDKFIKPYYLKNVINYIVFLFLLSLIFNVSFFHLLKNSIILQLTSIMLYKNSYN